MNCSDSQRAWICRGCGSFLSTQVAVSSTGSGKARIAAKANSSAHADHLGGGPSGAPGIVRCRRCAREAVFEDSRAVVWEDGEGKRFVGGDDVTVVVVPGVLRYLDVELAAMGIRMKFRVDN
jgi:DNA-directed RNA polymerase I subunit RPA2